VQWLLLLISLDKFLKLSMLLNVLQKSTTSGVQIKESSEEKLQRCDWDACLDLIHFTSIVILLFGNVCKHLDILLETTLDGLREGIYIIRMHTM